MLPDLIRARAPLAAVAVLHVAAWGGLALVIPRHYTVSGGVYGLGLGLTAYTLGVRHAFDADHIAAIDNTTRRLLAVGRRPASVGFWFALGHSSVVVALAVAVGFGARWAGSTALSTVQTSASGLFLYLIAALNLVALVGILRMRRSYEDGALESALASRGLLARMLGRLTRSIRHPAQMYPVGVLLGLGFDTASEVTLLALAGAGAVGGLPWLAMLVLPVLFAAGMTLFDTLDGVLMTAAYRWAFNSPARRVYYNATVTGLSVAVALVIGTIELVGVLRSRLSWTDPVSGWIASIGLNGVGFVLVGIFAVVWLGSMAYWRLGRVEQRWALAAQEGRL